MSSRFPPNEGEDTAPQYHTDEFSILDSPTDLSFLSDLANVDLFALINDMDEEQEKTELLIDSEQYGSGDKDRPTNELTEDGHHSAWIPYITEVTNCDLFLRRIPTISHEDAAELFGFYQIYREVAEAWRKNAFASMISLSDMANHVCVSGGTSHCEARQMSIEVYILLKRDRYEQFKKQTTLGRTQITKSNRKHEESPSSLKIANETTSAKHTSGSTAKKTNIQISSKLSCTCCRCHHNKLFRRNIHPLLVEIFLMRTVNYKNRKQNSYPLGKEQGIFSFSDYARLKKKSQRTPNTPEEQKLLDDLEFYEYTIPVVGIMQLLFKSVLGFGRTSNPKGFVKLFRIMTLLHHHVRTKKPHPKARTEEVFTDTALSPQSDTKVTYEKHPLLSLQNIATNWLVHCKQKTQMTNASVQDDQGGTLAQCLEDLIPLKQICTRLDINEMLSKGSTDLQRQMTLFGSFFAKSNTLVRKKHEKAFAAFREKQIELVRSCFFTDISVPSSAVPQFSNGKLISLLFCLWPFGFPNSCALTAKISEVGRPSKLNWVFENATNTHTSSIILKHVIRSGIYSIVSGYQYMIMFEGTGYPKRKKKAISGVHKYSRKSSDPSAAVETGIGPEKEKMKHENRMGHPYIQETDEIPLKKTKKEKPSTLVSTYAALWYGKVFQQTGSHVSIANRSHDKEDFGPTTSVFSPPSVMITESILNFLSALGLSVTADYRIVDTTVPLNRRRSLDLIGELMCTCKCCEIEEKENPYAARNRTIHDVLLDNYNKEHRELSSSEVNAIITNFFDSDFPTPEQETMNTCCTCQMTETSSHSTEKEKIPQTGETMKIVIDSFDSTEHDPQAAKRRKISDCSDPLYEVGSPLFLFDRPVPNSMQEVQTKDKPYVFDNAQTTDLPNASKRIPQKKPSVRLFPLREPNHSKDVSAQDSGHPILSHNMPAADADFVWGEPSGMEIDEYGSLIEDVPGLKPIEPVDATPEKCAAPVRKTKLSIPFIDDSDNDMFLAHVCVRPWDTTRKIRNITDMALPIDAESAWNFRNSTVCFGHKECNDHGYFFNNVVVPFNTPGNLDNTFVLRKFDLTDGYLCTKTGSLHICTLDKCTFAIRPNAVDGNYSEWAHGDTICPFSGKVLSNVFMTDHFWRVPGRPDSYQVPLSATGGVSFNTFEGNTHTSLQDTSKDTGSSQIGWHVGAGGRLQYKSTNIGVAASVGELRKRKKILTGDPPTSLKKEKHTSSQTNGLEKKKKSTGVEHTKDTAVKRSDLLNINTPYCKTAIRKNKILEQAIGAQSITTRAPHVEKGISIWNEKAAAQLLAGKLCSSSDQSYSFGLGKDRVRRISIDDPTFANWNTSFRKLSTLIESSSASCSSLIDFLWATDTFPKKGCFPEYQLTGIAISAMVLFGDRNTFEMTEIEKTARTLVENILKVEHHFTKRIFTYVKQKHKRGSVLLMDEFEQLLNLQDFAGFDENDPCPHFAFGTEHTNGHIYHAKTETKKKQRRKSIRDLHKPTVSTNTLGGAQSLLRSDSKDDALSITRRQGLSAIGHNTSSSSLLPKTIVQIRREHATIMAHLLLHRIDAGADHPVHQQILDLYEKVGGKTHVITRIMSGENGRMRRNEIAALRTALCRNYLLNSCPLYQKLFSFLTIFDCKAHDESIGNQASLGELVELRKKIIRQIKMTGDINLSSAVSEDGLDTPESYVRKAPNYRAFSIAPDSKRGYISYTLKKPDSGRRSKKENTNAEGDRKQELIPPYHCPRSGKRGRARGAKCEIHKDSLGDKTRLLAYCFETSLAKTLHINDKTVCAKNASFDALMETSKTCQCFLDGTIEDLFEHDKVINAPMHVIPVFPLGLPMEDMMRIYKCPPSFVGDEISEKSDTLPRFNHIIRRTDDVLTRAQMHDLSICSPTMYKTICFHGSVGTSVSEMPTDFSHISQKDEPPRTNRLASSTTRSTLQNGPTIFTDLLSLRARIIANPKYQISPTILNVGGAYRFRILNIISLRILQLWTILRTRTRKGMLRPALFAYPIFAIAALQIFKNGVAIPGRTMPEATERPVEKLGGEAFRKYKGLSSSDDPFRYSTTSTLLKGDGKTEELRPQNTKHGNSTANDKDKPTVNSKVYILEPDPLIRSIHPQEQSLYMREIAEKATKMKREIQNALAEAVLNDGVPLDVFRVENISLDSIPENIFVPIKRTKIF